MKVLKCCEVCDAKCEHIVEGVSEREMIRAMFYHGEVSHKELLREMNDGFRERVTEKMHALIHEV